MKKVSIIVPVYHVEPYLRQSIESVLNQSYQNIEVLLVDDGGDDACPDICEEYCRIDKRVKCIHKVNEGQSMARKAGLLAATGDYIMYLDADDWLDKEAVQNSLLAAEKHKADIVCFAYKRIYKSNVFETPLFENYCVFSEDNVKMIHRRMVGLVGKELAHVEAVDRLVTMWGKLYTKKTAMSGIFVSEREVGSSEDAIYNLGAFEACTKCVYIHEFLYNYRKTDGNSTTGKYRKNLPEQWKKLYRYFEQYIQNHQCGKIYEEALNNRIALGLLGLGLNELGNSGRFFEKSKNLNVILKQQPWKDAYQKLDFQYFPLKWKVFYGLCKYNQTELLVVMLWLVLYLKSRVSN